MDFRLVVRSSVPFTSNKFFERVDARKGLVDFSLIHKRLTACNTIRDLLELKHGVVELAQVFLPSSLVNDLQTLGRNLLVERFELFSERLDPLNRFRSF